jgi:hypothetical protein
VQTETALVRTESRVELDSETAVDGDREVVALPGDSELDDTLGDLDDGEGATVVGVLLEELGGGQAGSQRHDDNVTITHGLESRGDLVHGLKRVSWCYWGRSQDRQAERRRGAESLGMGTARDRCDSPARTRAQKGGWTWLRI